MIYRLVVSVSSLRPSACESGNCWSRRGLDGDETRELHRIISASVRDMLDAYRLQAQAGPVTDKALEQIVFRAAHAVVHSLSPYPAAQR